MASRVERLSHGCALFSFRRWAKRCGGVVQSSSTQRPWKSSKATCNLRLDHVKRLGRALVHARQDGPRSGLGTPGFARPSVVQVRTGGEEIDEIILTGHVIATAAVTETARSNASLLASCATHFPRRGNKYLPSLLFFLLGAWRDVSSRITATRIMYSSTPLADDWALGACGGAPVDVGACCRLGGASPRSQTIRPIV